MTARNSQPSFNGKRFALRATCVLFALALLGGLVVFGLERSLIYFPSRELHMTPDALGLVAEDIVTRTQDGQTIHGFLIRQKGPASPRRPTLLLSHGNAGTVADRLHRVAHFQERLDVDVALYDYRGYGKSTGSPTEEGTYQDAHAVYDWLLAHGVAADRIVLFGESLGCAVSVQLALDRSVRAVILEAPFASIRAMAKRVLPWLPVGPLLRTRYDNQTKIARLTAPLLIFHGTADEVIPLAQGQSVFDAAPQPKRLVPIDGAHHNDVYIVGGQEYLTVLDGFLRSLTP